MKKVWRLALPRNGRNGTLNAFHARRGLGNRRFVKSVLCGELPISRIECSLSCPQQSQELHIKRRVLHQHASRQPPNQLGVGSGMSLLSSWQGWIWDNQISIEGNTLGILRLFMVSCKSLSVAQSSSPCSEDYRQIYYPPKRIQPRMTA